MRMLLCVIRLLLRVTCVLLCVTVCYCVLLCATVCYCVLLRVMRMLLCVTVCYPPSKRRCPLTFKLAHQPRLQQRPVARQHARHRDKGAAADGGRDVLG
jgi:hypothetical protein